MIELKHPDPVHVKLSYPPHTGFGTEEDSLASCLHLTPRPPFQDINKLMLDADKVLRFSGKMLNNRQEDVHRRFVIAIYLADDSVGVWELRQRNSGHAEGKFALKGKKRNPATGKWFKPTDFQIGGTIEVNSTPFLLTRGDDATLRYMEKYCEDFPCADIRLIIDKLRPLRNEFLQMGETIIAEEVQRLAESRGISLNPHEMVTLRRFAGEMVEFEDDEP